VFKLFYYERKLPFLSFAIVSLIGTISAYFLKYDTVDRALDVVETQD
jgi:hypothetical protein